MRGEMPGVEVPLPLGEMLPAIYQEDHFTMEWCRGLDDVAAPAFATLDCLEYYVDPRMAPSDFLDWLGSWVGILLDESWPVPRRRAAIASAVELFRYRGTVDGLTRYVALLTGGDVTVVDNGGVVASRVPGGDYPGEPAPRLAVRVAVEDPSAINENALDRIVVQAKPAHVVHRVEVVAR